VVRLSELSKLRANVKSALDMLSSEPHEEPPRSNGTNKRRLDTRREK